MQVLAINQEHNKGFPVTAAKGSVHKERSRRESVPFSEGSNFKRKYNQMQQANKDSPPAFSNKK